jgi:hypothetical protein
MPGLCQKSFIMGEQDGCTSRSSRNGGKSVMETPNQEYRLIPLTQGQFAKVDAADFEWLNQWKWCSNWSK